MNKAGSKSIVALLTVLLLAGVAGCGGDKDVKASRGSDTESTGEGRDLSGEGLGDRGLVGIDADERAQFTDPNNPLSTRVFYFDFDSDVVRSEYNQSLDAHANYLKKKAGTGLTIRLEGHADERGTREYNIALAERRANAVKRALMSRGVSADSLTVLSYGEERPADEGHDESAWARNRRVELVYPRI